MCTFFFIYIFIIPYNNTLEPLPIKHEYIFTLNTTEFHSFSSNLTRNQIYNICRKRSIGSKKKNSPRLCISRAEVPPQKTYDRWNDGERGYNVKSRESKSYRWLRDNVSPSSITGSTDFYQVFCDVWRKIGWCLAWISHRKFRSRYVHIRMKYFNLFFSMVILAKRCTCLVAYCLDVIENFLRIKFEKNYY